MALEQTTVIEWVASLFPVRPAPGGSLTLLFTDIEGFTACAAARGDAAALRLLRHHDAAVLPAVRRYMGRILKRLGDGTMVAFASPPAALGAALAMQRAVTGRAPVRLRIGIHAGPARARAGDLVGHDVNVAARIADRAAGGEILVSEVVRSAASDIGARFRKARPLVVGGGEPIALFSVRSPAP